MTVRYIGMGAACLMFVMAQGCSFVRYAAVDNYHEAEQAKPVCGPDDLNNVSENPELYTHCLLDRMKAMPDETVRLLGKALTELPDMNYRPGLKEAMGLKAIYETAFSGRPDEKALLISLARENAGEYQYGGSLQGLLWMAGKEGFNRSRLKDQTRETLLDYAWEDLDLRLNSPEAILKYLAVNFSYILNAGPVQRMKTFFKSKYGDCSEFSLLAGYFLDSLGLEVFILLTRPSSLYGHISVVYRDDQGFWLLDGSRAALTRILEERKAREPLSFLDLVVWHEIKNFNRLYGPFSRKEALVSIYEKSGQRKVPFNFISYATYRKQIETFGEEAGSWWRF